MPTLCEFKHKSYEIKSSQDNKVKKDIALVKEESHKLYQEIIDNGYPEPIAKAISDDLSTKGGLII